MAPLRSPSVWAEVRMNLQVTAVIVRMAAARGCCLRSAEGKNGEDRRAIIGLTQSKLLKSRRAWSATAEFPRRFLRNVADAGHENRNHLTRRNKYGSERMISGSHHRAVLSRGRGYGKAKHNHSFHQSSSSGRGGEQRYDLILGEHLEECQAS